ncbi:phage major tail protein, TP901-1 family [Sporosarcina sp. ITBMC105]
MAIEYRGEEKIFAVEVPDELANRVIRPFNQTGGSKEISADSIDLDTKDKSGSDYGKITESVSLEGILTEGDEFIDYIVNAIRTKEFVKIYEIDTRTKKAEHGMYMISSFNREYGNGDFATYSLEGTLNGVVTPETLVELPTGAPAN